MDSDCSSRLVARITIWPTTISLFAEKEVGWDGVESMTGLFLLGFVLLVIGIYWIYCVLISLISYIQCNRDIF